MRQTDWARTLEAPEFANDDFMQQLPERYRRAGAVAWYVNKSGEYTACIPTKDGDSCGETKVRVPADGKLPDDLLEEITVC